MSDRALVFYRDAREQQLLKNDARRIRTRVKEARDNPNDASGRWPFELLQNAYDTGPHADSTSLTVRLGWVEQDGARVVSFEHDGAPFESQDIAALLSGGSSKEFESDATTGRFGTGFLVTHVLSHRVQVEGLLLVEHGLEQFAFELDRSGDEADILDSTTVTDAAIRAATVVDATHARPAARFSWRADEFGHFERGIASFEQALPYVFGTCPLLGRVEIRQSDGRWVCWQAGVAIDQPHDDPFHAERAVVVTEEERADRRFAIVRVPSHARADPAALFLVEETIDGLRVVEPPDGLARVFRRFPVRGTSSVPVAAILDGPFDVDQERRNLALVPADRERIAAALEAATRAVRIAFRRGIRNAHRLARASLPSQISDRGDFEFWSDALRVYAAQLAALPIVNSIRGFLPALPADGAERWADFPLPTLDADGTDEEFPLERMWELMARTEICDPPLEEVTADWAAISSGWASLEVGIRRLTLRELAKGVSESGTTWAGLTAPSAPAEWLPDFLDVVGMAWVARHGVDVCILDGLLPDQGGILRDASSLERDVGVPEALKDIAHDLGIQVRDQLLHLDIESAARDPRWPNLAAMLEKTLPKRRTKEQVVHACINELESRIATGRELDEAGRSLAAIASRLLAFLWEDCGVSAAQLVQRVPLLMRSGGCERANGANRKMMPPVSRWPSRAQRFVDAWPPSRVLAEMFAVEPLASALCAWDLAFPGPVIQQRASELKGERLAGMMPTPFAETEMEGLIVRDETFTQIALLQPEVFNHCLDRVQAAALLGFVVDYLAREDATWRVKKRLAGRRANQDVSVEVRDALWLGDLKARKWVPVASGEDSDAAMVRASAETLRDLLDNSWLVDNPNAVELLSECFGFDALDLQLLGLAPNEVDRQALRDQLARLVVASGGRLDLLAAALNAVETQLAKAATVKMLRNYGLAVQDAVQHALSAQGLTVDVVDHGFDFEVALNVDAPVEDLSLGRFSVGTWLVEVKATVRDEVALTPLQARTAASEPERFVLCVVQLTSIPSDAMRVAELVPIVQQRARVVLDVGPDAAMTTGLVTAAVEGAVGVRHEQQLRYAVHERRWQAGLRIEEWIAGLDRPAESRASGYGGPEAEPAAVESDRPES